MRKELTTKQKEFIQHFVEIGDHMRAATLAGYKDGSNQGRELRRKLAVEIEEAIREQMGSYVPLALQTIASLAKSSEQDSVRLKASSELLSRTGYDAVKKVEQTNLGTLEGKSDTDLMAEFQKLVGRLEVGQIGGELLPDPNKVMMRKDAPQTPSHAH